MLNYNLLLLENFNDVLIKKSNIFLFLSNFKFFGNYVFGY